MQYSSKQSDYFHNLHTMLAMSIKSALFFGYVAAKRDKKRNTLYCDDCDDSCSQNGGNYCLLSGIRRMQKTQNGRHIRYMCLHSANSPCNKSPYYSMRVTFIHILHTRYIYSITTFVREMRICVMNMAGKNLKFIRSNKSLCISAETRC